MKAVSSGTFAFLFVAAGVLHGCGGSGNPSNSGLGLSGTDMNATSGTTSSSGVESSGTTISSGSGGTGSSSGAGSTGASSSGLPSSGSAGSGTANSGTSTTGTASAGTSGSDVDAAPGDDDAGNTGNTNDPETDYAQTKTISMAPFNVPPNQEVFYCQTFANPWGKQVDIKTYNLTMDAGSHHMFAFYQTNATDASTATPCAAGGLTFGPFTFTSQTPTAVMTFPATVGATIPQTTGFNMMAHYLNTSSSPITAHVSLQMYVAKSGAVTNHAGIIFLNNVALSVPSTGTPVVSTSSMTINQAVSIMAASSHMHKFATNFVATATPPGGAAQMLYTTTQWDEPKPVQFNPPLQFPSGTKYTWSCTDVNNTGTTLTFGEYAQTNVMCIAVDIFYPVQDVANPTLGSAIGGL